MKIKIREIKIGNNLISVMADMHSEFGRKQQRLGIKYADVPRNAVERDDKKAKKELVRRIVAKMELEGLHENFAIDKGYQLKFDFFAYADEFIKRKAPICETRTYEAVLLKLKKFLGKDKIPCGAITESMMIEFKDFLEAELNGISAYNYFKKLKRMMKEATIAKYFKKNPTENILNKKRKCAEKDSLSVADVKRLAETPCSNEIAGRGFLFSCYTGLRYCDIVLLKWENIKDGYIDIVQKKTGERLLIQLHPSAIELMGERKNDGDLVFRLPSHTGCLKILRKWKEEAGLEAHVTWHVSRVSFATALLTEDVDLLTVSKLLGHKNLLQSQVYLRISESKKHSAINRLPSIF
jgi:integrase/recombinase XerD